MEPKQPNYIEQLRKNWIIIAFIAGTIIGWTNIQNNLKNNEAEIQDVKIQMLALQVKVDSTQQDVSNVSGDIKEIKATLSFIKASILKK